MASFTDAGFDRLSFHDCHIWGLEFRAGDADRGEWVSDLVLDLDYIVEWICGVGGGAQFRVAPATLVFEGATDLNIAVDWGRSGFRCALHQPSIDRIEREPVSDQKIYLDRTYYSWTIRLNWPAGGKIAFGAAGFVLTTRGEAILTDRQKLSIAERTPTGSAA
jgi:hypothetical protein